MTILRLPTVLSTLGVGKTALYRWVKQGEFPAPVKIGPNTSGWLRSEVDAWIDERASRRGAAA